jgi:hypothetical protein
MQALLEESNQAERVALARTAGYYHGLTSSQLEQYASALGVSFDVANKTLARRLRERKVPANNPEDEQKDALEILQRAKDKKAKAGAKAVGKNI